MYKSLGAYYSDPVVEPIHGLGEEPTEPEAPPGEGVASTNSVGRLALAAAVALSAGYFGVLLVKRLR